MSLRSLWLGLIVLVLGVSISLACLDVSPPPPGSPLDWSAWSPGISTPMQDEVLSGLEKRSKPEEPDAPDGDATVTVDMDPILEQIPKGLSYRISLDPWAECGVTTQDIPAHLDWWNTDEGKDVPPLTTAMRYKMLAHYVRMHLYPDQLPTPDIINHLIEIGQPAHFAAVAIQKAGDASPMMKTVSKNIVDAVGDPVGMYVAPADASLYECILADQLGNGYPFDYDPHFGEVIAALGESILPSLIAAATDHPHNLVRRNAVYMLRNFPQEAATRALRDIVTAKKDRVAMNRALNALIKRHDKALLPWLIEEVKNDKNEDTYWRHMCVYALGAIGQGSDEAAGVIMAWMKPGFQGNKFGESSEYLWTGTCALARLGANSQEVYNLYQDVKKRFAARKSRMHQAALLGMVAGGSKQALEEIWDLCKGLSIGNLDPAVTGLAMEAIGKTQAKFNKDLLGEFALDKRNNILVRYHCMRIREFQKKDEKILMETAKDDKIDPILRSVALVKLYGVNSGAARELAYSILDSYVGEKAKKKIDGPESNEIVLALQLIGPSGRLTYSQLSTLLNLSFEIAEKAAKNDNETDPDKRVNFVPAPLFETAMLELARSQTREAEVELIRVLQNKGMPNRKMAARALGMFKSPSVLPNLIAALGDKDKYVRLFSNLSLQALTGQECAGCNWLRDDNKELTKGITFWKEWYKATYPNGAGEPGGEPEQPE